MFASGNSLQHYDLYQWGLDLDLLNNFAVARLQPSDYYYQASSLRNTEAKHRKILPTGWSRATIKLLNE